MCASNNNKGKDIGKEPQKVSCDQWSSEGFFHSLIQYTPNVILFLSKDHQILEFNPGAERLYGRRRADVLGKDYFELFLPVEVREAVAADIEKVLTGETSIGFENVVIARNGQQRKLSWNISRVLDANDKPIGIVATGQDITEPRQTESALREERDKLQALMDGITRAGIGIDIVGADYRVLFQNETLEQRFGDIRGEPCYKHYMTQEYPCDHCPVVEAIQQNAAVESEQKGLDGQDYQIFSAPLPEDDGSVNKAIEIVLDITERKQAQEKLRQKDYIIESASSAIVTADLDGKMTYANPTFFEMWGINNPDEFLDKSFTDYWMVADKYNEIMDALQNKGEWTDEIQARRQDGSIFYVQVSAALVKDKDGNPVSLMSSSVDITDQKKAEEELKESEEKYHKLFDTAFDGFLVMEGYKFIDCNEIIFKDYGLKNKNEIVGLYPWDISPPKQPDGRSSKEKALELMDKAYAGEPQRFYWKHQYAEGEFFDMDISLNRFDVKGKQYLMIAQRNITERKQAERRIQEYQGQLKSLASELSLAEERERRRIAAGLHDDIAQKLAMAKFGLQSLQASAVDADLSQSLEKQCQVMEQIVEDARSLTFELSNPLLYEVGLEAAVESHLAKRIQQEFEIECKFKSEGPLSSLGDDIKVVLFQAVRELLANVVKHANASKVGVCITNSEDELKVIVEDDGAGFNPARIGPHRVGEGGFGLFNIRERLEYLGGNLEIESGRKKGACVIMSIPIKADTAV
ncbi:MAG: PAS domain-containing sensor histidine kinase [Planctomycetota bacterium]|jgi:PAS domain S-box-containing protein